MVRIGEDKCCYCNSRMLIVDHDNIVSEIDDGEWLSLHHVEQFPLHKYIADKEHALLPDDVNRWISFLAVLGIKFPENIECIE